MAAVTASTLVPPRASTAWPAWRDSVSAARPAASRSGDRDSREMTPGRRWMTRPQRGAGRVLSSEARKRRSSSFWVTRLVAQPRGNINTARTAAWRARRSGAGMGGVVLHPSGVRAPAPPGQVRLLRAVLRGRRVANHLDLIVREGDVLAGAHVGRLATAPVVGVAQPREGVVRGLPGAVAAPPVVAQPGLVGVRRAFGIGQRARAVGDIRVRAGADERRRLHPHLHELSVLVVPLRSRGQAQVLVDARDELLARQPPP